MTTRMNANSIEFGGLTTAQRDALAGIVDGTTIYNTSLESLQAYGPGGWKTILALGSISATGGTKDTTSRSGFTVHTFTSPGSLVVSSGAGDVEYLVIGGAGAGSAGFPNGACGAGGGAGGYLSNSAYPLTPGTYTIQVGGGGPSQLGASPNTPSPQAALYLLEGTPSYITNPGISSITAKGGGGGGYWNNPAHSAYPPSASPFRIGSGGGGGNNSSGAPPNGNRGYGDPTQGNDGGQGGNIPDGSGGGGGAGSIGGDYSGSVGGAGGSGAVSSINGTSVTRAGGGGGGGNGGGGSGGPGGGGAGGGRLGPGQGDVGTPGTTNTGGGGGGSGGPGPGSPSNYSGAGGSGIVIIAYPT